MIRVVLPDMIAGMSDKCSNALPTGAFLDVNGKAMADHFRPASTAAWPIAKPALLKLGGDDAKMLTSLPDEALRPLVSSLLTSAMSEKIKPEQCLSLNRLVESMAPLQAENVSNMILAIIELSGNKPKNIGGKSPNLSICPSPSPKPAPVTSATISPSAK